MSNASEHELVQEMQQLTAFSQLELDNSGQSLKELHKAIAAKILLMMNGPAETLMQLLYRVDVKEELARKAFAEHTDPDQLAEKLAGLVLERMIQKVETRIRYRNGTL